MSSTANIIIDVFILIFTSIGILISFGIFFLLFHYRHQHRINTSTLLICNNYLAVTICCLLIFDMYVYNLYGNINENISFENWWCYTRAYLLSVAVASLYHSFVIQAFFRLFRIVFYKKKQLQKFRFMFALVLIQWLMDFILLMPLLVLHQYEYISQYYYYCQALYTNYRGILNISIIIYYFPMFVIGSIYVYILYYMRQRRNAANQEIRHQVNQRDLVVLRRIIILIGMLFMIGFPTMLIYFEYLIIGYLYPLIYQFQWLTFAVSSSILPMIIAFLTPELRELLNLKFRPNRRIHPTIIIQQ